MSKRIAILHYSAPPVVGGVEAVIQAHVRGLIRAGCQVTVVAGKGTRQALPKGSGFELIPEMDSQHAEILQCSRELEQGRVPASFEPLTKRLEQILAPVLEPYDNIIIHNLFTKHFNLPLTTALFRLLDGGALHGCIAWCHDLSWTSPHSLPKVHPGYPWDYLRAYHPDVTYVAVSRYRQSELAGLLRIPQENIKVVYDGVDPQGLLGLTPQGAALIERLGLWESDLIMLMPVRVTQAKNIEFAIQVTAALKAHGLRPALIVTGPPDPHDPANMEYFRGLHELRGQANLDKEVRFVYESDPERDLPFEIDSDRLGELYRFSDLLFLPSHREGFGMPVLEAGLVGLPVVSAAVPAAKEIGRQEVTSLPPKASPLQAAQLILKLMESSSQYKLRKRVRTEYTWQAIIKRDILPLLQQAEVVR
jgi:glycosyltransferase involved in cell wall biosynthesis